MTAEKRVENLRQVSSSIEVKSRDHLRQEGKSRIDEIMKGTVDVAAQDSQVGVSFTIRGVASVEGGAPVPNTPQVGVNATYQHAFTMPGGSRLTPKLNYIDKTQVLELRWRPRRQCHQDPGQHQQYRLAAGVQLVRCLPHLGEGRWQVLDQRLRQNIANQVVLRNYGGSYAPLDAPRTYGVILQGNF